MFSSLFTDPYHYFRISSSNTYMYLIFMQKTKICKKWNRDLIKACWCNQKISSILKFRIEAKNAEICFNQEISTYTFLPNSTWKQKKKLQKTIFKTKFIFKGMSRKPTNIQKRQENKVLNQPQPTYWHNNLLFVENFVIILSNFPTLCSMRCETSLHFSGGVDSKLRDRP